MSPRPRKGTKPSGIAWVGAIPEDWVVKRAKFLFSLAQRQPREGDGIVTAFRDGQVTLRTNRRTDGFTNAAKEAGYQGVRRGDLVIHAMDAFAGAVGVSDSDGKCTPVYSCCVPKAAATSDFYARCVRTMATTGFIESLSKGIRERSTDFRWATFAEQFLPVPPLNEQLELSAFIDRETSRTDELIAKKERFIELLREKRQALIARAVTKGLITGVPMKDSGVAWLGEVPAHWKVSKLAYEVGEMGGKTPTTGIDRYWEGDVPWVTPKDMKSSEISDSIDKITVTALTEFGMALVQPGAILIVVRGMILSHSFPSAELLVPATINQDMKALVPKGNLYPSFLRLLLDSYSPYVVSMAVAEAAHGTRVLRTDVWRLLPVLIPPLPEQMAIVADLQGATSRIDALVVKTECSIELLRERRTALITAAVTGKIDVSSTTQKTP